MNPSHAGHFQLLALHRFREAVSSVDTIPVPKKPFCFFDDDRNKGDAGSQSIKQRGSIMVAIVLNAIYRAFLRRSLPGMASLGAGR